MEKHDDLYKIRKEEENVDFCPICNSTLFKNCRNFSLEFPKSQNRAAITISKRFISDLKKKLNPGYQHKRMIIKNKDKKRSYIGITKFIISESWRCLAKVLRASPWLQKISISTNKQRTCLTPVSLTSFLSNTKNRTALNKNGKITTTGRQKCGKQISLISLRRHRFPN